MTAPIISGSNITNSTTVAVNTTALNTIAATVDEDDPCGGGVDYRLDGEIFCTPEEYEDAPLVQY